MVTKSELDRLEAWALLNISVPENQEAAGIIQRVLNGEKIKINPQARPKTDPYIDLFTWAWEWAYRNKYTAKTESYTLNYPATIEFRVDRNTIKKRIKRIAASLGEGITWDHLVDDLDVEVPVEAKNFKEKYLRNDFVFHLYSAYITAQKNECKIL